MTDEIICECGHRVSMHDWEHTGNGCIKKGCECEHSDQHVRLQGILSTERVARQEAEAKVVKLREALIMSNNCLKSFTNVCNTHTIQADINALAVNDAVLKETA